MTGVAQARRRGCSLFHQRRIPLHDFIHLDDFDIDQRNAGVRLAGRKRNLAHDVAYAMYRIDDLIYGGMRLLGQLART